MSLTEAQHDALITDHEPSLGTMKRAAADGAAMYRATVEDYMSSIANDMRPFEHDYSKAPTLAEVITDSGALSHIAALLVGNSTIEKDPIEAARLAEALLRKEAERLAESDR